MSRYRPDSTVVIGGQRCAVLRDVVSHVLPTMDDVVVLGRFGELMVYCAAAELERARARHPNLPAYGFWQVLLQSGQVEPADKNELQAVYFDDGGGGREGQYLYQGASGVAFTGEIRGGRWIAAGGYTPDPAAACILDCDVASLRLPRRPVLSFEEHERERARRKLRFALRFAAVVVFLGAALATYDGKRRAYVAEQQTLHGALKLRAAALEAYRDALRGTRIEMLPDQRRVLDDLLRFAVALDGFTLDETPLDRSSFVVHTENSSDSPIHLLPALAPVVHAVEHRRDGLVSLHWRRER